MKLNGTVCNVTCNIYLWELRSCLFLCASSQRYIHEDDDSNDYVMYDLDELDLNWLQSVNTKRKFRGVCIHIHQGVWLAMKMLCM